MANASTDKTSVTPTARRARGAPEGVAQRLCRACGYRSYQGHGSLGSEEKSVNDALSCDPYSVWLIAIIDSSDTTGKPERLIADCRRLTALRETSNNGTNLIEQELQ